MHTRIMISVETSCLESFSCQERQRGISGEQQKKSELSMNAFFMKNPSGPSAKPGRTGNETNKKRKKERKKNPLDKEITESTVCHPKSPFRHVFLHSSMTSSLGVEFFLFIQNVLLFHSSFSLFLLLSLSHPPTFSCRPPAFLLFSSYGYDTVSLYFRPVAESDSEPGRLQLQMKSKHKCVCEREAGRGGGVHRNTHCDH